MSKDFLVADFIPPLSYCTFCTGWQCVMHVSCVMCHVSPCDVHVFRMGTREIKQISECDPIKWHLNIIIRVIRCTPGSVINDISMQLRKYLLRYAN